MSLAACASAVEAGDPDRFAATMAAPVAARARLWPLYALNLELARAPWASAEPMVAEMRLQWWVDALAGLASGKVPAHPIGGALADLGPALDPTLLIAIAEARRWDCWHDPFADEAAFDAHIDATAGNLMWQGARLLGAPASAEPVVRDHAYGAGLAAWLRAVPVYEARDRVPLPDRRAAAVACLAERGIARLGRAAAARAKVPAKAAPALYWGWQARAFLMRARRAPDAVTGDRLASSEFRRRAGLLRLGLTGRW